VRFWGQVLWLAGLVGAVSPFLPDPGDHAASDNLPWWGKVCWIAGCVVVAFIGSHLSKVAERRERAASWARTKAALDDIPRPRDTPG
jgi:hypothetical protein